jgi:hypothetical protein
MDNDKIIEMINLYSDGELKKSREAFLFTQLSENYEAREYFKQLNNIKAAVAESVEEFPEALDERILKSINSEKSPGLTIFSSRRLFMAASFAASIILLIVSGYLFLKISSYNEKVDDLSQQLKIQSKTIEMLYNSLPGIEVESSLKNAIIIKPNS